VVTSFSYTIETLIQAGRGGMAVAWVPVRTNASTRPSRLFTNIPQFLRKSVATMLRAYVLHRPLSVFITLGLALFAAGSVPIGRFLYYSLGGDSSGHIQSLILGCALVTMGTSAWIVGLLADLISANRQLMEITLEKVRRLELGLFHNAHGVSIDQLETSLDELQRLERELTYNVHGSSHQLDDAGAQLEWSELC
jgi:hypothetical protein